MQGLSVHACRNTLWKGVGHAGQAIKGPCSWTGHIGEKGKVIVEKQVILGNNNKKGQS